MYVYIDVHQWAFTGEQFRLPLNFVMRTALRAGAAVTYYCVDVTVHIGPVLLLSHGFVHATFA